MLPDTNNAVNNVVSTNPSSSSRVNTTQACAACKYQRRKCAPDCILAPYFPHDRQRQFLNAHKLFGVSNITKIIRNLDQPEKDMAMRTIVFQSDVRASDPVGGCYRIVRQLQHQIDCVNAELNLVQEHLALYRALDQEQQQQQQMFTPHEMEALGASYEQLQIQPQEHHQQIQPQEHHQQIHHGNFAALQEATNDSWGFQGSSASSVLIPIKKQHSIQECNSIFKPLFEGLSDDSPEFRFEAEQTIKQSDEQGSMKNEQVGFKEE